MGIPQEQTERIEVLRGLIERLSAPDLTLTEAKALRGRISDLLEPEGRHLRQDQSASVSSIIPPADPGAGPFPGTWSPDPSMRVAG